MSSSTRNEEITISEVGPRDGLQSAGSTMPTDDKIRWISALSRSGLREIEVGSFVSPRKVPQLADTGDVVASVSALPGLRVATLAPNLRGVRDAVLAGADTVSIPVSASESHSRQNVGMSTDEAIEQVRLAAEYREDNESHITIEAGVATAFGCTIEGKVAEARVVDIAVKLAEAGADSVGLSDTTGYANPSQVRRLFSQVRKQIGDTTGSAHLHNTRGQGLANVVAALDTGVTTFDASQAGLGGCPWAPGATGNIVTEDLVYLLEAMGLHTGVDIAKLLDARHILARALPHEELYGHVPEAGLPKGFTYARENSENYATA